MKSIRAKLPCVIEGCNRMQSAKGLCTAHYIRQRKGQSLAGPIRIDKIGPNNPKWKGGQITDPSSGRVLIYAPNHPNPSTMGKYVYRYRLVMEEKLGRFLKPGEIVHHVNGVKNDDRPENLQVMSQSQHATIDTPFGLKGRWAMSGADKCAECGTSSVRHEAKNLCVDCYGKVRAR